jgi:hypothetical protein
MTNQSLRERFKIADQNAAITSSIIIDSLEERVLKEDDPESKSGKYASYNPIVLKILFDAYLINTYTPVANRGDGRYIGAPHTILLSLSKH